MTLKQYANDHNLRPKLWYEFKRWFFSFANETTTGLGPIVGTGKTQYGAMEDFRGKLNSACDFSIDGAEYSLDEDLYAEDRFGAVEFDKWPELRDHKP